jgi:hypothetical protein
VSDLIYFIYLFSPVSHSDLDDDDDKDAAEKDPETAVRAAAVKLAIAEAVAGCGTLERCTLFPRNPACPAALRFDSREACRAAIALLDGGMCRERDVTCRFLETGESLAPRDDRAPEDKLAEEERRHAEFARWIEEGGEEPGSGDRKKNSS